MIEWESGCPTPDMHEEILEILKRHGRDDISVTLKVKVNEFGSR